MIKNGSLPISELFNEIGNYTAARNEVILDVVKSSVVDGEFSILSKDGKAKRASTMPKVNDRIILPPQKSFSFGSTKKGQRDRRYSGFAYRMQINMVNSP